MAKNKYKLGPPWLGRERHFCLATNKLGPSLSRARTLLRLGGGNGGDEKLILGPPWLGRERYFCLAKYYPSWVITMPDRLLPQTHLSTFTETGLLTLVIEKL